MFPWRRRRDWFFDDFFKEFEEEFREIEKDIMRIIEETMKIPTTDLTNTKPYIYGFSIRVGPDGEPRIERFGNIPNVGLSSSDEREPLVDVIEGKDEITIVAEIPGVEKDDIKLSIGRRSIEIRVDNENRKYYKRLNLPCEVIPEKARANYKNGVLEIKVKRLESSDSDSINIKIE
ncbi:MAG: Hsp20/alpha crystallin family protein [Candidatus Altiarchaeales archaeon]|nr:MAG: Hsp20/alpha crystallin family protein [Candidatus Altiarchaeales archaeon]RLI95129.1 MAG: Hsp20/alpha crystallin family protein [Candidatus Altiarchaeales archaeon]HDO82132.1 Hsp20/alpha crystallin family protein [Candidatus Altiarchaeales archaeon]HEX54781.1 Hsp20/alpha crystallin family protein [Candidatus Altiarchaeales archaeon]